MKMEPANGARPTAAARSSAPQDPETRIERIESLVEELEREGDARRNAHVRELLEAFLELHGAGLNRILEEVYRACGQEFIDRLAEDDLVRSVLLLHDLHPAGMAERVVGALDSVRPYLASHGGNVELVGVEEDGTVSLRLEGSCHGCPSSEATLKFTIEEAIYAAAPDVRAIEIVEPEEDAELGAEFIPMSTMQWDDCPFPSADANQIPTQL